MHRKHERQANGMFCMKRRADGRLLELQYVITVGARRCGWLSYHFASPQSVIWSRSVDGQSP